tara:strand:- start:1424 stop:1627 length:204 start_codon:yes stop_codon:yes gene_type:complete
MNIYVPGTWVYDKSQYRQKPQGLKIIIVSKMDSEKGLRNCAGKYCLTQSGPQRLKIGQTKEYVLEVP